MKNPVMWALVALTVAIAALLSEPWISAGYEKYGDRVYCQTHEPFVQHSWNTNWHHCPVASYT